MESNLNNLKDFIEKSGQLKDLQSELSSGNIENIGQVFELVSNISATLEDAKKNLPKEEREKLDPLLKKISKEGILNEITNHMKGYADRSK